MIASLYCRVRVSVSIFSLCFVRSANVVTRERLDDTFCQHKCEVEEAEGEREEMNELSIAD